MIMIIGSSHDDVLYFESILTQKRNEMIYNRYPAVFGRLFNQDVVLVYEVYTNYISSLVTNYLISKYFILLVFTVGTCVSYSEDIEFGTIGVSSQVMLSDIDQIGNKPVRLGQLPNGFPQFFKTDSGVKSFVNKAMALRTYIHYFDATFLSSNTYFYKASQLEPLLVQGELTSIKKHIVFDSIYGGVALSCYLNNISSIAIKVVETHFMTPTDYLDYSKILESYAAVGKIVVTSIGDIGRTDILEEEK